MDEIEFLYIGWCKQIKKGVTSDKIWCAFKVGHTHYAGWGARGKKIRFKEHGGLYPGLNTLIQKKQKQYDEVDHFQLFTIFPYFKDDVGKYLTYSKLTNTVM